MRRPSPTFISLLLMISVFYLIIPAFSKSRIAEVRERITPSLKQDLAKKSLKLGDPVYLRVFKNERILEVWMKPSGRNEYILYNAYRIAGMSGKLGPKLKEGDFQAPEGFYNIVKENLNPQSSYHLSFNIGYPNAYDRAHKRTGSFIMVHGSNVSAGCYAMTDPVIESIYLIVESAFKKGQSSIPFHSFPFMYEQGWEKKVNSSWAPFWKELEPGYQIFQREKRPASVQVKGGQYIVK